MKTNTTRTFKLIIFGDASVGKTMLVKRFVTGVFDETALMTLGMEVTTADLILNDTPVILQVWDLAGEQQFRLFLPSYCQGAHGGIFVYDITSPSSLAHIQDWMAVVQESAPDMPVIVTGAKKDLETERKVPVDEAKSRIKENGIKDLIEVSSKTGENVDSLFKAITLIMMNKYL